MHKNVKRSVFGLKFQAKWVRAREENTEFVFFWLKFQAKWVRAREENTEFVFLGWIPGRNWMECHTLSL